MKYYLPKGIIDNYNIIINGKNIYDQAVGSDIKQYREIWILTTAQGYDYTSGCLLDYDYTKNHYRLTAVDLSRQKESDAATKVIQQIEFVGQSKNLDNAIGTNESMVILTILEKIKETRSKFSPRKCNSIMKDRKLSRSLS